MNWVMKIGIVVLSLIAVVSGVFAYLYSGGRPDDIDVGTAPTMALSKEDAKYLQQVEHLGGFVFGDLTLPKFSKALKEGDAQTLTKFIAADFKGRLFSGTGRLRMRAFATLRSWKQGSEALQAVDGKGFVKALLAMRNEFSELKICAVKVMQMQPDKHDELTGGWNGSFKIILAGKLTAGGIARRIARFAIKLNRLPEDMPKQSAWLSSCSCYEQQMAQAKDYLMTDMTAETGIKVNKLHDNWLLPKTANRPALTGGIYLCDYNRDGLMDLLVADLQGTFFYKGQPGARFVQVNDEVGLPENPLKKQLGAVFADFNGDGFEDLVLGNRLYKNDNGKRFVQLKDNEHSLYLEPGSGQFAVADYDLDGKVDLYVIGLKKMKTVLNWVGKNDQAHNQLWRNLGDFQFVEVTRKTKTAGNGSSAFGAIWFDANSDGRPDLLTACEFGMNDYLLNDPSGVFKPGPMPPGYGGFSMGITFSDVNNDGRGDPYIANMYSKAGERIVANLKLGLYKPEIDDQLRDFVSGNELYHNVGGKFKRIGRSSGVSDVGWAYGVGFVDLDGDGFPEPYAPVGYQSVTASKPDG